KIVTKLLKNNNERTLTLPSHVVTELTALEREPHEPLILSTRGETPNPDYFTDLWASQVRQFITENPDVPYISLHELRHTHATHLLAAGVNPKAVQTRLGHETFAITMDLYSHVLETGHEESIDKLE